MFFVIACIFAAAMLPYLFLLLSGWPSRTAKARWGSSYSNTNARDSLTRLDGWRQRAHFTQLNGHESFPAFAAAMLSAQLAGVGTALLHALALLFLGARIGHGTAYVLNAGVARSVIWSVGLAAVIALFAASLLRLAS